jgi:hypothetical protein
MQDRVYTLVDDQVCEAVVFASDESSKAYMDGYKNKSSSISCCYPS